MHVHTVFQKLSRTLLSGIIHYEFVPTGQTVNQVYYLEVLKRLREKLDGNNPSFFQQLIDLASRQCTCSHSTVWEGVFSYKTNDCVGTPCLFTRSSLQSPFLFPKIKEILKGRHFDDIDDIRSNTKASMRAIPQNQFQNYFEGWRRWHQCIPFQRD